MNLDYTAINNFLSIKPFFGAVKDINLEYNEQGKVGGAYFKANRDDNRIVGPKRVVINFIIAATFARMEDWKTN